MKLLIELLIELIEFDKTRNKPLIIDINNKRPNTEACGTPVETLKSSDNKCKTNRNTLDFACKTISNHHHIDTVVMKVAVLTASFKAYSQFWREDV